MKNIIIDCDPGHDDAVAIFLALAHKTQLNLLAVTTVCGNNTLEKVTMNAKKVLEVSKANAILAKGSHHPLVGDPIISDEFHGATGMDGPLDCQDPSYPVSDLPAVQVMREMILNHAPVTLVAIGPLTNVALLLTLYPEIKNGIECISLMGGGIKGGNYTPYAEFNIAVDPEAAKIVFSANVPIVMSGLDVTEKALIYPNHYRDLRNKSRVSTFFVDLMDFYFKSADKFGVTGCAIHDACSIAYLLKPELFQGRKANIDLCLQGEQRGQTVEIVGDGNTLILTDINQAEFETLILNAITSYEND